MIKSLALFTLFLVQGIQGFCIYNRFTDGTSFTINQNHSGAPQGNVFNQHVEMGTVSCCHFSNKDCSRRQRNGDSAQFIIDLHVPSGAYPPLKLAICSTGGALVLSGTETDYYAKCVYTNGVTLPVRLLNIFYGRAMDPF